MGPVGVLALQGGFAAHLRALERLGRANREVRSAQDLRGLGGLILPGGESTAQLRLLQRLGLWEPLREFCQGPAPVLGTCAGLILLARNVQDPAQPSLALLGVTVQRNAWGRQVDSFSATSDEGSSLLFIRAPRISALEPGVRALEHLQGEPVLVRAGHITGACYHPELTDDLSLHRRLFLSASNNVT